MDKTSMTLGYLVGKQIVGMLRTQEKQPIAYLYNGVQLPPLPESDNPYAFMFKDITGFYRLWLGNEITYNGSNIGFVGTYLHYYCTKDGWNELSSGTNANICGIQDVEWANFDVLNSDGSVYLSASDPIPVYESDEPEKQLIGYSYNGVVLPDINEVWTDELKQQYPYAVILPNNTLLCAKLPYYIYCDGQSVPTGFLFGYDDENLIFVDAVGWLFDADSNSWSSQFMEAMQIIPVLPMWTSHELYIMDTDTEEVTDTLYLATSDPIPVYE